MRGLLVKSLAVLLLAAGYVASPFWAAWSLREAIRSADIPAIERKVDFERVRATLRASIAQHADLLPAAKQAGSEVRPSLWQRIKSAFGANMLDRFMETYVTAAGLPELFKYRKAYKETLKGELPEEQVATGERLRQFYQRLVRAEFMSPTLVEIEIRDRYRPERHYVSSMELVGFEWKLVGLKVVAAGAADGLRLFTAR